MFLKNIFFYLVWWYPTSNGIIITSKKMYNKIGGFDESLKFHEDGVFIVEGLQKGETIVIAGIHTLMPGQVIRPVSVQTLL